MKKAFTLSETIITIGIIGIVAAITLPSLIAHIQDIQYRNMWKRQFSIFQDATKNILNDYEGSFSNAGLSEQDDTLMLLYTKYIKTAQICNSMHDNNGRPFRDPICWSEELKYLNKKAQINAPSTALFLNGTGSAYYTYANTCKDSTQRCGYILVDINGKSKPNTIGRDIYRIEVYDDRIEANSNNDCEKTSNGFGCSKKYLK
ncbi:prepilin-type N-terminal cleavage/methylation domain-containing protein [bacterium]|nr:prepilin-type N-terminal cleavage/methylation domain-containing protein [bacterium]